MAEKAATIESVNLRLAELGAKEILIKGKDYFYFWGGDAPTWESSSVYGLAKVGDYTDERWIDEYEGLSGKKIKPVPGQAVQLRFEQFPMLTADLTPRQHSQLRQAFEWLNDGLLRNEIANVAHKEAYQFLGAEIKRKWEKTYEAARSVSGRLFYELDLYGIDSTRLARAAYRKLLKIDLPDNPILQEGFAFLQEVQPLVPVIDNLKEVIVKRQPKSAEEKATSQKFVPPPTSKGATAAVRKVLEEVTLKAHDALLDWCLKHSLSYLNKFKNMESDTDRYNLFYKNPYFREIVDLCIDNPSGRISRGDSFQYVDNPEAALLPKAQRDAKQMQDMFVYKNLAKISAIVEGKGNLKEIIPISGYVDLSGLTGTFRLKFNDGSQFVAHNSVVYSVSTKGKAFARYPLTFHDVVFPDGSRMKQPSEEKMNVEFAKIPSGGLQPIIKEVFTWEGDSGVKHHLTRKESLIVPIDWLADMEPATGVVPDWDETKKKFGTYQKRHWEEFLLDVQKNKIKEPIKLDFMPGGRVGIIHKGSHRLQAAMQAGIDFIPVEARYYGQADLNMETLADRVESETHALHDRAAQYQANGGMDASDVHWERNDSFKLGQLGDRRELIDWMIVECAAAAETKDAGDPMIDHAFDDVVILRKDGEYQFWSGKHKVAAALRNGETKISAILGKPAELKLEKNLDSHGNDRDSLDIGLS